MRHLAWIAGATLAACTTAPALVSGDMRRFDRDTTYVIRERPDGFDITVQYERYQFIPETAAVLMACKSALLAAAHSVADRQGRPIMPINEQRIQLSPGRNGVTGMTSCQGSAPAYFFPEPVKREPTTAPAPRGTDA